MSIFGWQSRRALRAQVREVERVLASTELERHGAVEVARLLERQLAQEKERTRQQSATIQRQNVELATHREKAKEMRSTLDAATRALEALGEIEQVILRARDDGMVLPVPMKWAGQMAVRESRIVYPTALDT